MWYSYTPEETQTEGDNCREEQEERKLTTNHTHTHIANSQQTEPKFYQNYLRNEAYSRRNRKSLRNQDLPRRSTSTSWRQTSSTKTPTLLMKIFPKAIVYTSQTWHPALLPQTGCQVLPATQNAITADWINKDLSCLINAPGEQAVVFSRSSSTITKSNRSWYLKRLHRSMQAERRKKLRQIQLYVIVLI